ncbi:hypothetical protein lerEdw1_020800 [Lerista edwardsae]|nr:hypothetical protein lerEdw1_020800 [Lerista edwardsae]
MVTHEDRRPSLIEARNSQKLLDLFEGRTVPRKFDKSVQGVTLTDLQEAEKTIDRNRTTRTREQENEEKEKQDKEKQEGKKESETKDNDYKQRHARTTDEPHHRYKATSSTATSYISSSQLNRPNSLIDITSAYSKSAKETEKETEKKEEEEDKSQTKSIRERRRPREKRRSTGVSFWTQDVSEKLLNTLRMIDVPNV